ncbi:hypothetical protein QBC40DRAFT_76249 [Triangularia verruculosa]|uniref:Uncharacterized protein n=1 Tax=Triangularia verruculosa TaxID=2587418 RepID=A0AAN7AVE7_9PEZI|nr:hypothetical protein QBC40DRAFT_76249 [Triangularia verruculosa]
MFASQSLANKLDVRSACPQPQTPFACYTVSHLPRPRTDRQNVSLAVDSQDTDGSPPYHRVLSVLLLICASYETTAYNRSCGDPSHLAATDDWWQQGLAVVKQHAGVSPVKHVTEAIKNFKLYHMEGLFASTWTSRQLGTLLTGAKPSSLKQGALCISLCNRLVLAGKHLRSGQHTIRANLVGDEKTCNLRTTHSGIPGLSFSSTTIIYYTL